MNSSLYYRTLVPSLVGSAALLLFAGCSDPSANVHKAETTTPGTPTAAAMPAPESTTAREFVISPDSKIEFEGSKVTGSHKGGFKQFAGSIRVENGKIVGTPAVEIQMDSTWSDNDRLTGHLKSPDFFDVASFPTSTFKVTSVEPAQDGHRVTGDLQLHGVTRTISFPAEFKATDDEVQLKAEFAINRKDFNILYPGKPDDLIRDNVVIRLDIKATPGTAAAAGTTGA